MPASADADATAIQLTSPSTADVPMVATAVCAIVFTALTAAAFVQFFQFLMMFSSLFDVVPISTRYRPIRICIRMRNCRKTYIRANFVFRECRLYNDV